MVRNHLKAVTSRKNQGTRKVNKVILYCEGRNTEPSYFELLKRNNCKVVPVVVPGHGIGSLWKRQIRNTTAYQKFNATSIVRNGWCTIVMVMKILL